MLERGKETGQLLRIIFPAAQPAVLILGNRARGERRTRRGPQIDRHQQMQRSIEQLSGLGGDQRALHRRRQLGCAREKDVQQRWQVRPERLRQNHLLAVRLTGQRAAEHQRCPGQRLYHLDHSHTFDVPPQGG